MMRRARTLALLAAGIWMAAASGPASAQKPAAQQRPAAQQQPGNYDVYEPGRRQRLRRETCLRDEEPAGAYCVKQCDKGYRQVPDSKPPRCRSVKPLPPGQRPGPVRRQTGEQPRPAAAPKKAPAPPGAY